MKERKNKKMKLVGETLTFETIDPSNLSHQKALHALSKSGGDYLGNLSTAVMNQREDKITGNDYLVLSMDKIIGYLGLSAEVETSIGKTSSLYYGVLESEYGKGYGSKMLKEILPILKENTDLKVLIANVDKTNHYSLNTVAKAGFVAAFEDEEDIQFQRHVR